MTLGVFDPRLGRRPPRRSDGTLLSLLLRRTGFRIGFHLNDLVGDHFRRRIHGRRGRVHVGGRLSGVRAQRFERRRMMAHIRRLDHEVVGVRRLRSGRFVYAVTQQLSTGRQTVVVRVGMVMGVLMATIRARRAMIKASRRRRLKIRLEYRPIRQFDVVIHLRNRLMRRTTPDRFLIHLVLHALTATSTCTVRYSKAVGAAVIVLVDSRVHRTIMRRALMIRQRHFVRLMPLPSVFVRLPSFALRGQRGTGAVLRRHQRSANRIDGFRCNDHFVTTGRRWYRMRLRYHRIRVRIGKGISGVGMRTGELHLKERGMDKMWMVGVHRTVGRTVRLRGVRLRKRGGRSRARRYQIHSGMRGICTCNEY